MADSTTGGLPAVTEAAVGDLPNAATIYDDLKIPAEHQGEAVHILGGQLKNYAAVGVARYVEDAKTAADNAMKAAQDALKAVESVQGAAEEAERAEAANRAAQAAMTAAQSAREAAEAAAEAAARDAASAVAANVAVYVKAAQDAQKAAEAARDQAQAIAGGEFLPLAGGTVTGDIVLDNKANIVGPLDDPSGRAHIDLGHSAVWLGLYPEGGSRTDVQVKGVATPTKDSDAANKAYVDAQKPVLRTVTLPTAGWSSASKQIIVQVDGVLADQTKQMITVAPDRASHTAYYASGVRCVDQANGALLFRADTVPTAALTVYAAIQGVAE